VEGEKAQAFGAYDVGFRKFFNLSSEDILVQSAIAEASLALGKKWSVGVQGRGKDRRGGERSYTDLVGAAFVELNVVDPLDIRVLVGAHRFLYRAFFPYSFSAPELGLRARYRFDKHHSVYALGEIGLRNYNAIAQPYPDLLLPLGQVQRKDDAYVASVEYRYRGPFTVSATYSYANLASNSFGESIRRHRVAATTGFRLPWKLTLLLEGSLQFTEYPDKVYGSPDIVLVNDENLNSVSFKLVRPLDDHVDLELQFAWYQAKLPGRDMTFTYVRAVGGIGLTWRL
jgi:hypothetical protein